MSELQLSTHSGVINYLEFGNPKNPTIICLHGLIGNSLYSFGELIPYLRDHFHLILLDNPGHGKTTSFPKEEDYLFSNLAIWLERAVEKIVKGPFYIMGHSWGADIALHYTRYYPDKVLGLILLDGAFTFPQNQPEMTFDYAYLGWKDYMDHSLVDYKEEIYEEYQSYTKKWNSRKEKYSESLFRKRPDGKFELVASKFSVLAIVKAFFKEPFQDAFPFINAQTLLIHADYPQSLDAARNLGILQLLENIKDFSVYKIDGTSHMLQWDQPQVTAHIISQWIDEKLL
ncbi:alpha/beta hydrolase [Planococcus maritimus]|uniref:alpha/beta fold hydrolase n=1 Tax=Planococcus maritimus TaxID=192421 RepID=UPI00080F1AD6|nr:alpha/beta hydrolase [Planococcus maritimus]ANU18434.1 alpha/beta hydrolase [Planococcus maritimus]